ncbi:MAG: sulfatase/phosphatase domain-containing protein, partial [Segetibacter sp.]
IAYWPAHIPANKVNNTSVMSVVDFVPTICALTGTKMADSYQSDGFDRSKILLGSTKETTNDIYWYYLNKPLPGKMENISPALAMRSGNWKLLMEPDGSNQQLYNLEKDQQEKDNVFNKEKEIVERLSAKLSEWYQQNVKGYKSGN